MEKKTTAICNICFFSASENESIQIHREIDNKLQFSYYPEFEWKKHGYDAPDGYRVLSAWRQPDNDAFAFLLEDAFRMNINRNKLILHLVGSEIVIIPIGIKLEALKSKYEKTNDKKHKGTISEATLTGVKGDKSIIVVSTVATVLTALINAISKYLREIPPPLFENKTMDDLYSFLLNLIHFGSLGLIVAMILLSLIVILKIIGRLFF